MYVLQNLKDPTQIGPSMGLALMSTIYSIIFYLLFFLPFEVEKEKAFQRVSLPLASTFLSVTLVAIGMVVSFTH